MRRSKSCHLILFMLVLLFNPALVLSQNINILIPPDSSYVNQFGETISFKAKAAINSSYIPVVFIKDPINQWWPWLQAKPIDKNRMDWKLEKVQFGSNVDKDNEFQVQVIVIPKRDVENGIPLKGEEHLFVEPGEPVKNRIFSTILRKTYPIHSNVVRVIRK